MQKFLLPILILLLSCEETTEPQDCAGVAGGTAGLDSCAACVGGTTNLTACTQDCAEVWGGIADVDSCGTCDTDATNNCIQDCLGTWGGITVLDSCGTCDTDTANDCNADCHGDYGGTAIIDDCGNCTGGNTGYTINYAMDCDSVCDGNSYFDNCGICDNDPSNDCSNDCNGILGGDSKWDNCGTCDNDTSNDCVMDCAYIWGGTSWESDCGCVPATNSGDECDDCAGTPNGVAYNDNCDTCDSDPANDCDLDCAGVWGGNSELDNCDTCDSDSSNNCTQNCLGIWGGDSVTCAAYDIDGNGYTSVTIGSQEWLVQNLKTTKYRNGDPIPTDYSNNEWGELTTGAYSRYYSSSTYGMLYNWYSVDDSRGICPEGWHVPNDHEFKELEISIGMCEGEVNITYELLLENNLFEIFCADDYGWRGLDQGAKLKAIPNSTEPYYWENYNSNECTRSITGETIIVAPCATNSTGFSAIGAGFRTEAGSFDHRHVVNYLWLSGQNNNFRYFSVNMRQIYRDTNNDLNYGMSVRCLKD